MSESDLSPKARAAFRAMQQSALAFMQAIKTDGLRGRFETRVVDSNDKQAVFAIQVGEQPIPNGEIGAMIV